MNIITYDTEIGNVVGNQEKGLDVIAWIPFNDKNTNMLMYLFQCACGTEWYKKFSETKRYRAYYDFRKLEPQYVMAISYGLNILGEFEKNDEIIASESLFFDRLRLMEFIESNDCNASENLLSIRLIEKLIVEESIDLNL